MCFYLGYDLRLLTEIHHVSESMDEKRGIHEGDGVDTKKSTELQETRTKGEDVDTESITKIDQHVWRLVLYLIYILCCLIR
jgi:hypothetical protein